MYHFSLCFVGLIQLPKQSRRSGISDRFSRLGVLRYVVFEGAVTPSRDLAALGESGRLSSIFYIGYYY